MAIFLLVLGWWLFWIIALIIWKRRLFLDTWREPYFADTPVLIESDDWGPGGAFHAERLQALLGCLYAHRDTDERPAVLTADCVLSVPDTKEIQESRPPVYSRSFLDEDFPEIHSVMLEGISQGTFVPQLHGLEHLNGSALAKLYTNQDPRVTEAFAKEGWWDWESLDSPLQAHYVDGSTLPTRPIPQTTLENLIGLATSSFKRIFGHASLSTVAPCYLWNDEVEAIWREHGIRHIQTAGYRCPERDSNGHYVQDKSLIRAGDHSNAGQCYLVRNVMFEPTDGRNTPESAYQEALSAYRQALPITISTHRYNFTRSAAESQSSLEGLDRLLSMLESHLPGIRYLSSPELGGSIENPEQAIKNPFNKASYPPLRRLSGTGKIQPFFSRLQQRHPKLFYLGIVTGLILPVGLLMALSSRRHR